MSKLQFFIAAICLNLALSGAPNAKEAPGVVVDIIPVGMLVDRVMRGVGSVHVLLPPGQSPHHFSLRPSDARALQNADLIVWIGPELTPWLDDGLDKLSPSARRVSLLEDSRTIRLKVQDRMSIADTEHDHGSSESAIDGDEAEHDMDHDEAHDDDHDGDHDGEHEHTHAHGTVDPHAWLSPENALIWIGVIAEELSRLDPENADIYSTNAQQAQQEISAASADVSAMLAPLQGSPVLVLHDALAYFEHSFHLTVVGAVSDTEAKKPSARRISDLRTLVTKTSPKCILTEPGANAQILSALGTEVQRVPVRELDFLASNEATRQDGYPGYLRTLGRTMAECLATR